MSSGKQKRVAEKVIRVLPVHKEFVQQYIAKVRLERGEILTEAQALEAIFRQCEPELWEKASVHSERRGNGNGED